MKHLNVFYPYRDKPLNHEDQLTRALLVLLKNVKAVELVFVELVTEQMGALGCDPIPLRLTTGTGGIETIETQVWSTTTHRLEIETGRMVSVLITDARLQLEHRVDRSERMAVYDGIIQYRPGWLFVIENKPDNRNVWPDQLSSKCKESLEIEQKPVCLQWQEIIARIATIRENGLLFSADEGMVDDFLEFVFHFFPELNPYERFGLCKGNITLLEKRCKSLMEESAFGDVEYHRGWHYRITLCNVDGVKEITLYPERTKSETIEIRFEMGPGDTMNQARRFYDTLDVRKLLSLSDRGWEIFGHFHISYRSSNLIWAEKDSCDLEAYLGFWVDQVRKGQLRQVPRQEWDGFLTMLGRSGVLAESDEQRFREKIYATKMPTINVCPAVAFRYRWPLDLAERLDANGQFIEDFKQKVLEGISTWWNQGIGM